MNITNKNLAEKKHYKYLQNRQAFIKSQGRSKIKIEQELGIWNLSVKNAENKHIGKEFITIGKNFKTPTEAMKWAEYLHF
jgi:hypothetical protein